MQKLKQIIDNRKKDRTNAWLININQLADVAWLPSYSVQLHNLVSIPSQAFSVLEFDDRPTESQTTALQPNSGANVTRRH